MVILFALILSPASSLKCSDDHLIEDLLWHADGSTYAALIEFQKGGQVNFYEFRGRRELEEVFSVRQIDSLKLHSGSCILVFLYEEGLKPVSIRDGLTRYQDKIVYRTNDLGAGEFFPQWASTSIAEFKRILIDDFKARIETRKYTPRR